MQRCGKIKLRVGPEFLRANVLLPEPATPISSTKESSGMVSVTMEFEDAPSLRLELSWLFEEQPFEPSDEGYSVSRVCAETGGSDCCAERLPWLFLPR